jgi:hypothetical protein
MGVPTSSDFYDVKDGVMVVTLPGGDQSIPSGGSVAWPLPANYQSVKVTFNGRSPRTMVAGDSYTFAADERVRIINNSPRPINARIFNYSDQLRLVALPGGEFTVPNGGESVWEVPQDIDRAVVVLNGRWVYEAVRGTVLVHEKDDRIMLRNLSGLPVTARFYDLNDRLRWLTLPGGELAMAPQGEAFFTAPLNMGTVQAIVANQRFNVDVGETLLVNPNGSITRG